MAGSEVNAVDLTRELVRLRSINPPGEERACAEHLGRLLEPVGFEVAAYSYAEGRTSLIARLEGAADAAPICFTGHLDTVPLGNAAWQRDPLGAEIDGDRLYGRGSSDMKSGVAAMAAAAMAVAGLPGRKAGLVLVFTAGEETGCDGARFLAGLEKVLPRAGALLVGEPTGNDPLIGHKGAIWLQAVYRGVTAHGSMPELGDNAVYKAARGALHLGKHEFKAVVHNQLGRPTLNVGSLHGGLNVNSVPDHAQIQVDIRTVPGQSNMAVWQEIQTLLGEEAELARIVDVGPIASNPHDAWVASVFELCEGITGRRMDPRGAPFFTDASVLVPAMDQVPAVILGPGETAMAHKTDEYCLVSKIEQSVALYTEIARRWMRL
jgi:succinyl-diaminopimelate desuccinylase